MGKANLSVQLHSTCLRVVPLNEPMGKGVPFTAGSGIQSGYASHTWRSAPGALCSVPQQLRTGSLRSAPGQRQSLRGPAGGGRLLLRRRPRKRSAEPRSARVRRPDSGRERGVPLALSSARQTEVAVEAGESRREMPLPSPARRGRRVETVRASGSFFSTRGSVPLVETRVG